MNQLTVHQTLVLISIALVAALIWTTWRAWLDYESRRRLARLRRTPRIVKVPVDTHGAETAALRRELWVARKRIEDLVGQVNAARAMVRVTERNHLAVATYQAEVEITQAIPVLPSVDPDPTVVLELDTARLRRVAAAGVPA